MSLRPLACPYFQLAVHLEADLSAVWNCRALVALPFVFTLVFSLVFKFVRFEKATSRAFSWLPSSVTPGTTAFRKSLCIWAEGMDFATVFRSQGILLATYSVYVAASTKMDAKKALMTVLKMPAMCCAFRDGRKIFRDTGTPGYRSPH